MRGARPTLVIGEDHHLMVEGLRTMLQDKFDIIGVGYSGEELLELLRTSDPDGLLLDLSLPGRNGLDLLPDITALRPRIRVLVVTMHSDRVLASAAIHAGAHGFIPKDSGIEELEVAINEVLAGRHYLSPNIPRQTHRVALGASGEQPRDERGLEHRARQARVASDDEPRTVGPVLDRERRDELAPDPEREVGGERFLVGDAADTVGSEQARHRLVPSRGPRLIGSSG